LDGSSVDVDVAASLREPVGERERRVVQGTGERVAELPRAPSLSKLHDEVCDGVAGELAAEEVDGERDRHRGDDEVRGDVDSSYRLVGGLFEDTDGGRRACPGPPPTSQTRTAPADG